MPPPPLVRAGCMTAEHELEQRDFIVKLRGGIVSHRGFELQEGGCRIFGCSLMYLKVSTNSAERSSVR